MTRLQNVTLMGDTGLGTASGEPSSSTVDGLLVVDKPEGMVSSRVVSAVKKLLRQKKAGHCGTLDPFATGVMVICLNQATRVADQFLEQNKAYRFTLHLGIETDSYDRTGQVTRTYEGPPPALEDIGAVLERFRGSCVQRVPRHAAVRVQGRRLYEWTRKGVEVDLPEREIHIYELELLHYQWPEAVLETRCSKGTYIRQLAFDMGRALGCGGHVSRLSRLASGPFGIDRAVSLEELGEALRQGTWRQNIIPIGDALAHLPAIRIEEEEVLRGLQDGHLHSAWEDVRRAEFPGRVGPVRLVTAQEELIALWWPRPEAAGQGRRLRMFTR